jgi:sugar/nucleoside kinase (ribokinase family)
LIVGIGNPVYDYIETPLVSTKERVLSGCSTNACLAVGKLGQRAALVGRLGADFAGRFAADMRRYNIAHEIEPCAQTGGFSLVYYNERGDRTLKVLGIADPIETFPTRFASADYVLFGPILQEVSLSLVKQVRQLTSAPFFLDPQGLLRRIKDGQVEHFLNPEMKEIAPCFEVLKANEHEAQVMTGLEPRQDPAGAARALHDWGCRVAIVTLAEAGSVIYDGEQVYRIPAYETIARDPTGAGDTYAGGFMYRYLQGGFDLWEIGCFASSVASVMVEHTGPEFPLTLEEAERRTAMLLQISGNTRRRFL